jgi:cytochrome c oxidase assembly factor CtaG
MGLLGAVLCLAGHPLFSWHLLTTFAWNMTPLEDQELGGVIMWVPGIALFLDPNNLPFSNQARQGFENKFAELIAREMRARIEYVWWTQRRGYVRNTLNEGRCDHHVPRVDQPG